MVTGPFPRGIVACLFVSGGREGSFKWSQDRRVARCSSLSVALVRGERLLNTSSHTDGSVDNVTEVGKLCCLFRWKHGEQAARDLYGLHRHEIMPIDVTPGAATAPLPSVSCLPIHTSVILRYLPTSCYHPSIRLVKLGAPGEEQLRL